MIYTHRSAGWERERDGNQLLLRSESFQVHGHKIIIKECVLSVRLFISAITTVEDGWGSIDGFEELPCWSHLG